jgi:hypothetical protein
MRASRTPKRYLPPVIGLCLLAGIWADRRLFHLPVGDPGAYHAFVRAVADHLPYRTGAWVGTDEEMPPSAIAMLKPNLLLCRRFRNTASRETATFMIVQCRDARDMGGHYPPVCYPAHGWTLQGTQVRHLRVHGTPIPVSVYRFVRESIEDYAEIVIYNFFVRPDGSLESGRGGVREAASNPRMKPFGAGQVQLMFGPTMPAARRDEIFRLLVGNAFPVVDAIRKGPSQ